jgi:hypothetical protein
MNSYVVNLYPVPNEFGPGQALDVDGTVLSFTNNFDPKTTCCYISSTGGNFYVTFDGSEPSSTNGHHIESPYFAWWSKEATRVAKMIAQGGAIAHIRMSQFTY